MFVSLIIRNLTRHRHSFSASTLRLQRSYFQVLGATTTIPLLFISIPLIIFFTVGDLRPEVTNALEVYASQHGAIGTIAMILIGKSYRDYVKNKFIQLLNCVPNNQVGVVNSSVVERSTNQPKTNQAGQQIHQIQIEN